MSQISLSDLNAADNADFVAMLGNVVEHSPWIAEQLAGKRPFAGINQLHTALMAAIQSAEPDVQLALIRAHPDLASKTQRAAGLTAESTDEQNSAGLDRLSDAEYAAFERVKLARHLERTRRNLRRGRGVGPGEHFEPLRALLHDEAGRLRDRARALAPDRGGARRGFDA